MNEIVTYSRPLKFQGHLEHQRGNTSPSSWLVSNLNFAEPGVPWGNIRHLSKLPEGWEEDASLCESRFMLPRQPRFCVVWMRSRCSLDSKMGVSQSPRAGLPSEVTTAWVFPLFLEHGRDSLEYCFLLLHGGRSADEIKTRLEGQRKGASTLLLCRHLRAPQQSMQLSFRSSCPSWKSPSLGTSVPGSPVFINLPEALSWVIDSTVQFPISWMRETGLPLEHLFQTEAQCQSMDRWLRCMLLRMLRLSLVGRGL